MIDRLVLKRPKHLRFTHNFDDSASMPPHIPELIIHQLMKLPLFLMRGSMVGRVGADKLMEGRRRLDAQNEILLWVGWLPGALLINKTGHIVNDRN